VTATGGTSLELKASGDGVIRAQHDGVTEVLRVESNQQNGGLFINSTASSPYYPTLKFTAGATSLGYLRGTTTGLEAHSGSGQLFRSVLDDAADAWAFIGQGANANVAIRLQSDHASTPRPQLYFYRGSPSAASLAFIGSHESEGLIASVQAGGLRIYNSGQSYGPAAASAVLQADATNKGFLPPRMTTVQRNAISSPAEGLMVYDTDLHSPYVFNGTSWIRVLP